MSRYSNICILSPGEYVKVFKYLKKSSFVEPLIFIIQVGFERMLDSRLPDVFPCTEDKEGLKFYKV